MRHYGQELTSLTCVRLTPSVRDAAEQMAQEAGISLSDFVRQSIIRNMNMARTVEDEVPRRSERLELGYRDRD